MARFLIHTLWLRPRAGARFGQATSPHSARLFCAGVLAVLLLSGGGARADSGLPAATLKAVKAATVLLHVTLPDSETVRGAASSPWSRTSS
jgi:hypothetical protein